MSAPNPEPGFISPDLIANFYSNDGFRVFQSKSCWWYNQFRRSGYIVQFPFHRLVNPDHQELDEVFHHFPRALALRFISPRDSVGYPSAMWVCRAPFKLQDLKPNVRNHTKLGLKHFKIERMTFEQLVPLARPAHDDTTMRHGQQVSARLGLEPNLDYCPGYEAWGAFVQGRLAAYMVTLTVENWVHILVSRSMNEFLKYYPNNAIIVTILEDTFSRTGITAVNYGWESLAETESLQRFKINLGFVREPIMQRVVLRPSLRPVLNPITRKIFESISRHSTSGSLQRLNRVIQIASRGG